MNKLNLTLIGFAFLQAAILVSLWVFGAERTTTDAVEKPLVPIAAADIARVASIEISAPDAKDQKEIRLVKKEKSWVVATSDDYAVRSANPGETGADALSSDEATAKAQKAVDDALKDDLTVAGGFLKKLLKVSVKRPVLTKKANHDSVKVGDQKYERRVTLKDKDGKEIAQVFLSNGASSRGVYARRAGESEVYAAESIALYDAETESNRWVDTKLCSLKADDVRSATVTIAEGNLSFTLEKRTEPDPATTQPTSAPASQPTSQPVKTVDVWYVTAPETLKADKMTVENLLRTCTEVSVAEVLTKKAPEGGGFDKPTATAVIRTADGKTHTLTIGAKRGADSSDYYLKSSESEWYAVVSKWTVDGILDLKLDKLKEKPPAAPDAHDHEAGDEH